MRRRRCLFCVFCTCLVMFYIIRENRHSNTTQLDSESTVGYVNEKPDYSRIALPVTIKASHIENSIEKYSAINNTDNIASDYSQGALIPRIIHQTWDTDFVPGQVRDWVRSWPRHHPAWQYRFWTERGAEKLIDRYLPWFRPLYDKYPYRINRADVRRYVIMYLQGGVYADLDMESLLPLDTLPAEFDCILSQEPLVHQALLYSGNEDSNFAATGFMACRKGHPFFKYVVEHLQDYIKRAFDLPWNDNILKSTGPQMIAELLAAYHQLNTSQSNRVYVAPDTWFLPTFDHVQLDGFKRTCSTSSTFGNLTERQKQICVHLKESGYKNEPDATSFTDHHWLHTWSDEFLSGGNIPIEVLIPSVHLYD